MADDGGTNTEGTSENEEAAPWYLKHQTWIKENIKQRKCFIFSSGSSEDQCICLESKEDHDVKDGNKKWKKEINTKTLSTEHYGTAVVKDPSEGTKTNGTNGDDDSSEKENDCTEEDTTNQQCQSDQDNDISHKIQFIRIDEDTPMDVIKHLLFEVWNLTRPKWIFSLLGTKTEISDLEQHLETAFDQLSTTSDLWLISDGLHDGVSEYILKAKERTYGTDRVTSIGCFAWGDLWDWKALANVEQTENRHVDYILHEDGFDLMGKTTTHFFLVDNGTSVPYLCYLSNLSFNAKLIANLAASDDASSAIPAVAILNGGDQLIVLEGVRNLIKENVPVVIIKDSGGIADVMCRAFEESEGVSGMAGSSNDQGHVTVIDQRSKRRIKNDLERRFAEEENVTESLQVIIQCLQRRDLITVVDFSKDETLFHGFVSAIVKTKSNADLNVLVDEYLPTPAYNRKTKEKFAKHVDQQKESQPYHDSYDSEMIIKEIFEEALLFEKTECVEFILETGGVHITNINIEDLFLKTKSDLQKTVNKTLMETRDEFKVKEAVEKIIADNKGKHIFKRLYGLLKSCRKWINNEGKEKKIDLKILTANGLRKKVAKIVQENKSKDALSKEITNILRNCQKVMDISKMPIPYERYDGVWTDDNSSDDSDSERQGLPAVVKRQNTDDLLSSKSKGHLKVDSARERELEEYEENKKNAMIKSFTRRIIRRFIPSSCIKDEEPCKDEETPDDMETKEAYRSLFLWSVLTNRTELARVFWKRGQDLVVTALVAGTVMDTMAEMTFSSKKKAIRKESSRLYKQHCVGTMDACYLSDKKKTVMLLERNAMKNMWNIDFLTLAFEKQNSGIFQSDGLIYFTFSKWIGSIPKDTSTWRIVICTLFPFLIWVLIGKENTNDDKRDKACPDSFKKKDTTPCCLTRIFRRLGNFYSTPKVKFILSLVFYCVFLALYAHFLLVVLAFTCRWNWEIPLVVWVSAFTLEEVTQMLQFAIEKKEQNKTRRRQRDEQRKCITVLSKYVGSYFQDKWNVLDSCCAISFAIGYPLRFFAATYSYSRLFLSINFMCFSWRLLQACTTSQTIGPMMYMVFRMVTDLVPFLVILFVAIFSYAVASEAILYPNSTWSVSFVLAIPKKAFWQIFGEFFFDEIEGTDCPAAPCPADIGKTWVPFILAVYIVMTNVLLLNILIARFNHVFEEVREKANEVWAWQKCRLMMEYESKPPLPLPFTIIWRIGTFIKWLICKCKCSRKNAVKPMPSEESPDLQSNDREMTMIGSTDGTSDYANIPPAETISRHASEQYSRDMDSGVFDHGQTADTTECHEENEKDWYMAVHKDGEGSDFIAPVQAEDVQAANESTEDQPRDAEEGGDQTGNEEGGETCITEATGEGGDQTRNEEESENFQIEGSEEDGDQTINDERDGSIQTEERGEGADQTGNEAGDENLQTEGRGDEGNEDSGTYDHDHTESQPAQDNQESNEDELDDLNEDMNQDPDSTEEWYYDEYDYSDSDDSCYGEESDQEDPLDVFERQNAEYYIQTEKLKM